MRRFAALLDGLVFTPQRNGKLRLLDQYFRDAPDPDRGFGLAALTGGLNFRHAKPGTVRALTAERVDAELFALSYDFVGDLAETVALIWPPAAARPTPPEPSITDVVRILSGASRDEAGRHMEAWLDALDASGRYALLKLITGGLRVGVSSRLAKTALARFGGVQLAEVEELWHGLEPPYADLFAWLEGRAAKPAIDSGLAFRPLMLANPLTDADLARLEPDDHLAEWKWDGTRVQVAVRGDEWRLYSRSGDDITGAFPDAGTGWTFDAVLDGELLVVRDGAMQPFNELQQRLGRKAPSAAMQRRFPAHVRVYDVLGCDGEDLRSLPLVERRRRLEQWFERFEPPRLDLSPLVPFGTWDELAEKRAAARAAGIEGLMLKRKDSTYDAGRPKGPWFKWKRDALTVDCVLMYAQRGHGKRSSYYSDFTFGCWTGEDGDQPNLVPVGKAYFGFTDAELLELDRWVRGHTSERFGPVRAVTPGLVLEIAFDSVHPSSRHKSGVAMRFPRVRRIRWDKPAAEADRLDTLLAMIET